MKYFGSSMLAVLFLLQACGHDKPGRQSGRQPANKSETKSENKPADGLAVKKEDIKDVKATLSREDSIRLYMALLTASSGQDGIEGDCGNLGKYIGNKANQRTISVKIPYKACKVNELLIHGDVQITGKREKQERANAVGQLTVEGPITGFCNVNLNYPTKALFEILDNVNAENADLQTIEVKELKGKFCDVDIEELVKDVEKALAEQKAEEEKAAKEPATKTEAAKEPQAQRGQAANEQAAGGEAMGGEAKADQAA